MVIKKGGAASALAYRAYNKGILHGVWHFFHSLIHSSSAPVAKVTCHNCICLL
jgi:hypothetical protein